MRYTLAICLLCATQVSLASSKQDSASDFRSKLAEQGIRFDGSWTNFYQGATSGSPKQGLKYGGRLDLYFNFDGEKLANWKGGGVSAKLEYRYGDLATQGGAILPVQVGMLSPIGYKERPVLTSLYLTQKSSSGVFMFGKINAIDLLKDAPMMGGRGIDGFSNLEFAATLSGLTPLVIFGGVAIVPTKDARWTLMAYEPNDQTNSGGVANVFRDGVNLAVSASLPLALTDQKGGSHSFGIKYSTKNGADLSEIGNAVGTQGSKRGSWVVSYSIEQYLTPTWGFFGMTQFADGNPNIQQNSYQLGLGGKGLLPGRPQDRFGLGYFNMNFSDALSEAIAGLVRVQREEGIEAFYNYQLKEALNLVGDVQWVRPADASKENVIVLGVRAVVRF